MLDKEEKYRIQMLFARLSTKKAKETIGALKKYLPNVAGDQKKHDQTVYAIHFLHRLLEVRAERKEERKRQERVSAKKREEAALIDAERVRELEFFEEMKKERRSDIPPWRWRGTTGRRNRKGTCEQQFGCFWDD